MTKPTKKAIIEEFGLDANAHAKGRCSFSAEEQRVKLFMGTVIENLKKINSDFIKLLDKL